MSGAMSSTALTRPAQATALVMEMMSEAIFTSSTRIWDM